MIPTLTNSFGLPMAAAMVVGAGLAWRLRDADSGRQLAAGGRTEVAKRAARSPAEPDALVQLRRAEVIAPCSARSFICPFFWCFYFV